MSISSLVAMGFFPALPIRIPFSPGMEHWWDLFWWALQFVAMALLLITFRRTSDWVDQRFNQHRQEASDGDNKPHK